MSDQDAGKTDYNLGSGLPRLDEDARDLHRILSSEAGQERVRTFIQKISSLQPGKTLSESDADFSPGVTTLVVHFASQLLFDDFLRKVKAGGVSDSVLEKLKDLHLTLREVLARIDTSGLTNLQIHKVLEADRLRSKLSLNAISLVVREISWVSVDGTGGLLRPTIRLGMLDAEERLLLDSTLDWDDAAFLASSICNILADHIETSMSRFPHESGQFLGGNTMPGRLKEIEESLKKIRAAAPRLFQSDQE